MSDELNCATKIMLDTADVSARTKDIKAVVLHCTGGGIVDKALKKCVSNSPTRTQLNAVCSNPALSDKIVSYAAKFYSEVNKVSTGAVIGYCGEIIQTAPISKRAWSAGIGSEVIKLYKLGMNEWCHWMRGEDNKFHRNAPEGYYDFWKKLYEDATGAPPSGMASPLEFCGGDHGPDQIAFSVDLLTPPYQIRNGLSHSGPLLDGVFNTGSLYTLRQFAALRTVIVELATRFPSFVPSKRTVLPHSLTSPLERVQTVVENGKKVGYGFDPGALSWESLL